MFCPVDGIGRRPAAGRRRSLPGRASEPARAKEPIIHFPVQLCFVSKYNSGRHLSLALRVAFAILCTSTTGLGHLLAKRLRRTFSAGALPIRPAAHTSPPRTIAASMFCAAA